KKLRSVVKGGQRTASCAGDAEMADNSGQQCYVLTSVNRRQSRSAVI
ncbi:uncharacterized protein METZ01_LOCUS210994, partial [marine metagenome]